MMLDIEVPIPHTLSWNIGSLEIVEIQILFGNLSYMNILGPRPLMQYIHFKLSSVFILNMYQAPSFARYVLSNTPKLYQILGTQKFV